MTRNTKSESPTRSKFATTGLTIVRVGVTLITMAVASWLVVARSEAAFTGTTGNTGSSFAAGTIALVDDDLATAMFGVTNMVPGQTVTDCILVTYQGTVANPVAVKLYSGGYTDSGDFGAFLNLTIEEGTGGSFGDCTGFTLENTIVSGGTLADFDTASTNYATGAGVWDPSSTPASKTFRVSVQLDAATADAEQGESVTALTLTWETQS